MTMSDSRRAARSQPGVRLTLRGRVLIAFVVVSALLLALLLAFWLGTVQASHAAGGGRAEPYESLVLHPGQTLWEIAERRAPGADPRIMVHRIIEANDLEGAAVWAGQRIRVPSPPG